MQQTTFMCPFCLSSEVPLEMIGYFGARQCPLCDRTFAYRDLKNKGYEIEIVDYFETWQEIRDNRRESKLKNGDRAVEKMQDESIENLFHQIRMEKIFSEKAKKAEEKTLTTELDKLFAEIFNF